MKRVDIDIVMDNVWDSLTTTLTDHTSIFIESELWVDLYHGITNINPITIEMELRHGDN